MNPCLSQFSWETAWSTLWPPRKSRQLWNNDWSRSTAKFVLMPGNLRLNCLLIFYKKLTSIIEEFAKFNFQMFFADSQLVSWMSSKLKRPAKTSVWSMMSRDVTPSTGRYPHFFYIPLLYFKKNMKLKPFEFLVACSTS